jgi:AhpD family alkylhydroperoxidase
LAPCGIHRRPKMKLPISHEEHPMNARIDFYTASKEALSAMLALEKAGAGLGIDPRLLDLVKLRASQINGCAFCMDLHTSDARKAGESERRLATVSAWRETPFFDERERAALAWTEALTSIAHTHAPDADYELLAARFSPKEMSDLTLAIVTINAWNRFAIGFRKMPAA